MTLSGLESRFFHILFESGRTGERVRGTKVLGVEAIYFEERGNIYSFQAELVPLLFLMGPTQGQFRLG